MSGPFFMGADRRKIQVHIERQVKGYLREMNLDPPSGGLQYRARVIVRWLWAHVRELLIALTATVVAAWLLSL